MVTKVIKKFNSFEEADKYNIDQQINMTSAERLDGLRVLQERVYGRNTKDIKEYHLGSRK